MHMYKKELIKVTKELLKNVQVLKEDPALDIEKKFEVRRLSAALKKLPAADKEIIVYSCFENKTYSEIAELLFMDITTVRRKRDNIILEVGRKVYGMEREFWNAIHGENYYEELEGIIYNRIVRDIKRKVDEEF
ncbi:RNA polymerase sigma factor [Clostridium chromiireducens]|uniref:RNA polymerase sigma factor n=1 Tax=Clostridium chromiireducens TaxID=225345 RepID=UPI003AF982E7